MHRGFSVFGLASGYNYASAVSDLFTDSVVNRALPIYVVEADSAEFKVTDLIDVQFAEDLSTDSCAAILTGLGLRFLDSSEYRHNLWECVLDDTIKSSPLSYGNALHLLDETEWACARQYATPELQADPIDAYFVHQWNLKNTGQNNGTPDNDIDADSAWLIPLTDSSFKVAILDDGFTTHIDVPAIRLSLGYDVFYGDFDPSPAAGQNHGMACMGILASTLGDTGVVGVAGSSVIQPVRITDSLSNLADSTDVASAIRYAATISRVISNSWGYAQTSPIAYVANAIRDVVNGARGSQRSPGAAPGCVMIFAAGNYADNPFWYFHIDSVVFPANMPEVIAVGAIDNQAARWDYSCFGDSLDFVAPSGWDGDEFGSMSMASNLWTIDQMGNDGWNPGKYGSYAEETDDVDYTAMMGGTSGACPQVAGIVALLMARGHDSISAVNPTPKIMEILANTAEDLGSTGKDNQFGYGRVNAFKALRSIVQCDLNNDAVINSIDLNLAIQVYFFGQPETPFPGTADFNCDGQPDAVDLNQLINHLYNNGPPPGICFLY